MANSSSPNYDALVQSQASKEVTVNAFFDAASHALTYGRRQASSSGLTWGYYGGNIIRSDGTLVQMANGTVSLTASATNYIVAAKATGAVSASTATTNWDDTANYWRLYSVVTGAATVSSWTDARAMARVQGSDAAVAAHEAAADPHPGYATAAEVAAALSAITTSDVAEGTNLYHTSARVLATVLAGLSLATSTAVTASDTVLSGFGKLQAQINAQATSFTTAALSVTGNTTLGDASGDTLTINGTAVSIPNGLNFDSNTLFIDAANNRLYVGAATGQYTTPNGAGTALSPKVQVVETTSAAATGVGVMDGVRNRRASLFVDDTNAVWGLSASYGSGTEPAFVVRGATSEWLRIANSGNITLNSGIIYYSQTTASIAANTADGADSLSMFVAGGGSASASRGAWIGVHGNAHASRPGDLRLHAGDVAGGHITFATGADVDRFTIFNAGNATYAGDFAITANAAVGGGVSANVRLYLPNGGTAVTGATTSYGILAQPTFATDVTSQAIGVGSRVFTSDATYTLNSAISFSVIDGAPGAGSTITNQYGLLVNNLTAGTNVFGVASGIAAGATKWNIYASGTAKNYFNGNVLIGTTTDDGVNKLQVTGNTKVLGTFDVASANAVLASNGIALITAASTGADTGGQITFRNNDARRAAIAGRQEGASALAGYLQFGVRAAGDIVEAARLTSSGNLLIGTTTDSTASKLQVADDSIQITTAKTPASAAAAGVTGEIAWDTNYVYVCTATNTWKRAALSTW